MNKEFYRYQPHALLRFEVQVAEHCNLNCRNCAHYSPLAEEEFLDIKQYEKDLCRLSELFCGEMEWIRLMGGEPLLHPQINEIMKLTRKYFPYGHIYIISNGILLTSMPKDFYEVCRSEKIEIRVTKYPIALDYSHLEEVMLQNKIEYALNGEGNNRRPTMWRIALDTRGDFDAVKNFYTCKRANECLNLRNGRLYTCCTVAHAHHLIKHFNLDMAWSERNSIDIYKAENAETIMEKMVKPIPFCRYCDHEKMYEYEDDWSVSQKDRYEWLSFVFSDEDIKYLKQASEVYIYGAGNWGKYTLSKLLEAGVKISKILVTQMANNPSDINGIDVVPLYELNGSKKNAVCILAINGNVKTEIQHMLREKGITQIIPLMKI